MSNLHVTKLSAGELPHPWIITDDSPVIDKRPGRWTNGGQGWRTKRDALAALHELTGQPTGLGRPAVGTQIAVTVRPDQLDQIDQIAAATGTKRAAVVRDLLDVALGHLPNADIDTTT